MTTAAGRSVTRSVFLRVITPAAIDVALEYDQTTVPADEAIAIVTDFPEKDTGEPFTAFWEVRADLAASSCLELTLIAEHWSRPSQRRLAAHQRELPGPAVPALGARPWSAHPQASAS